MRIPKKFRPEIEKEIAEMSAEKSQAVAEDVLEQLNTAREEAENQWLDKCLIINLLRHFLWVERLKNDILTQILYQKSHAG